MRITKNDDEMPLSPTFVKNAVACQDWCDLPQHMVHNSLVCIREGVKVQVFRSLEVAMVTVVNSTVQGLVVVRDLQEF